MSGPRSIEFAGTDEELEKHLVEFARGLGGWAARDPKRGGWVVAAGSLLSTNPNTLAWRFRVVRGEKGLAVHPTAIALPWTRRKVARIVAYREGQLADYLTNRVRGRAPEKSGAPRLREPFASYGTGPQQLTASFAWVVASGLAALAVATLLATLASLPLMLQAQGEIVGRARVVEEAGGLALPNRAERDAMGFATALGAAAVFGFPLAFLATLVHVAALAAGEAWTRGARLPQASFAFLAILGAAAFFGHLPVLALPLGLLLPLGPQLGYGLVWGRRGERVREGPRPRPLLVAIGVAIAAGVLGAAAPPLAEGRDLKDRIALFRDKALLGNGLGRAAARFYYRHTLTAADPLKEFFAIDPGRASRALRTGRGGTPEQEELLRGMHFVVVPPRVEGPVDLDWRSAPDVPKTLPEARRAVESLSRASFRGDWLREVYAVAWAAVYYAGPLAALLVFVAVCCPFVSIMYRAMTPKAATVALLCCLLSTLGLMLFAGYATAGVTERMRDLARAPTPERLAAALGHELMPVRHEAAYRAWRLETVPAELAGPLLKAASDDDFRVRLWAVAALGKTRDPRALRALLERLDDRELFVRYRAAEGLGFLGSGDAVERLQRLVREGTWYEGLYALEALRRIDPARF
jgi:hypothetical protein